MANSVLNAPHFQTEEAAFAYVEAHLWADGRVCPHCGVVDQSSAMKGKTTRQGLYKCYACRKPFTVRMGTIFESSHLALHLWLQVIHLMCASKKGISTRQIQRMLDCSMKTAWFLTHRIREIMAPGADAGPLGGRGKVVEADETYIGIADGKRGKKAWGGMGHKQKIVSLVERGGHTFKRLLEMEKVTPGGYFAASSDGEWISFNTGLQNHHGADLLLIFQRYQHKPDGTGKPVSDWVYKGCHAPNDTQYRGHFGASVPDIAVYSTDSRDFVFDAAYGLEKDVFDHLFERANERAGLPNAPDEVVRNYLRGAIEHLIPKIRRNYKIAIPVYYVEEKRMQLLLPFISASDSNDVSCFLIDRDDQMKRYRLKTIFDLDQAYFSARLITCPDKDWLNP